MDAELVEEPDQMRVVRLVEDDEPGVYPDQLPILLDLDCIGMSARTGLAFDERDVREIPQLPGAAKTRDPGSDDGDPFFHRVANFIRAASS